jgi:RimJ/RimL family protein N-acetyltransferase
VEIRPVDVADETAFAAWYDAYRAADVHGRTHPMPFALEEKRARLGGGSVGERRLGFGAYDAGGPTSCGVLELPLRDNRDTAWAGVWTPPTHRGRGYGSAVLDHLLEVVREDRRDTVVVAVHVPFSAPVDGAGHPDVEWCTRRGFTLDISNVVRTLELPAPEAHLDRLAEQAAPHHREYTFRQFRGPVPEDILEPFGRLVGALMVEAPAGQVVREPELMDLERIRADEAVFEASGRTKYTTVAVAADGSLAAYTELVAPRHDAAHAYQWGTLVVPAHRGHRLGLAVKARNLRWAQRQEPGRQALVTVNAEVNAHMIAINEALGFRPVEREVELVRRL